ncbi:MAG: acetyl-CoA carboxylase biotin carboxyl carrier protein [Planctomycetota bacterium]|nr:acetyl-CoA carboxylase biotin carboxyl carrier protein [Planctomycetota bacterium]
MDLKLIQRLIAMMKRAGVAELDVEDPATGLKVRVVREGAPGTSSAPVVHVLQGGGGPAPVHGGYAPAPGSAPAPVAAEPAKPAQQGTPFQSPMVGTFYRAGGPDAEPFASVGTRVGPETTVCIIEAMKVMNEIKAETSGEVVAVLVENGEPVEFGQPLFLIKP